MMNFRFSSPSPPYAWATEESVATVFQPERNSRAGGMALLAVNSTYFCRGLELGPRHLYQLPQNYLSLQLQGIYHPLEVSTGIHMNVCMHTHREWRGENLSLKRKFNTHRCIGCVFHPCRIDSSPLGTALSGCHCGLNVKRPQQAHVLNTWSPACGTILKVMKPLKGGRWLSEESHWGRS